MKDIMKQQNNKDWTGNSKTVFSCLAATNHSDGERAEYDYYASDPICADLICKEETFDGGIWENCCGEGHLSKRFEELGYNVVSTDLIDRGYGQGGVDFFKCDKALAPNIVTNPPYAYAKEWTEHSLELLPNGGKLALFLPIQFLESEGRRELFDKYPIKTVYTCTNRILCGKNGDFTEKDKDGNTKYNKDGTPKRASSAKFYAWFVWYKGWNGDTTLKRIN